MTDQANDEVFTVTGALTRIAIGLGGTGIFAILVFASFLK